MTNRPDLTQQDMSLWVPFDESGSRPIAPTDIAQFIRLEQCERYLRLRLHERTCGSGFMRDYDVVPQSIPPLLTRSGARLERAMEQTISARNSTIRSSDQNRSAED